MISLIVTAWKEPKTIGRAVLNLLNQARAMHQDFELVLACPDRETYEAASRVARGYRTIPFVYIQDPLKGKPFALNMAFRKARGSIWVLTDGDVSIGPGALSAIVKVFDDSDICGATGRPICRNARDTRWGYWGHMFMDAAHAKRLKTLSRGGFYAMSGYLLAIRAQKMIIPAGVLDDVYISCDLHLKGKQIAYVPSATVYVGQPSTWKDWVAQKVRSIAGYQDLGKIFPTIKPFRRITDEILFFFVPMLYARSIKEFGWSLLQYPVRLYIWMLTYIQLARGRNATDLWIGKRFESTK